MVSSFLLFPRVKLSALGVPFTMSRSQVCKKVCKVRYTKSGTGHFDRPPGIVETRGFFTGSRDVGRIPCWRVRQVL